MKETLLFSFQRKILCKKRVVDCMGVLKKVSLPEKGTVLSLPITERSSLYCRLSDFFAKRTARYFFEQYELRVWGKVFVWTKTASLWVDADNDGVPEREFVVSWLGDLSDPKENETAQA